MRKQRQLAEALRELLATYDTPGRLPATGPIISSPSDVYRACEDLQQLAQEQLRILTLTTKNRIINQRILYQGTLDECPVRAAEVLRPAILDGAKAIILVHNHPSGDATPSLDDGRMTERIKKAAAIHDIDLLDHVVIAQGVYVSMKDRGLGGLQ